MLESAEAALGTGPTNGTRSSQFCDRPSSSRQDHTLRSTFLNVLDESKTLGLELRDSDGLFFGLAHEVVHFTWTISW
jgi:hypothetical protein